MIKKLTDKVFYMPQSSETDRPALGLICGNKYSLVVDSGNSPRHAKEFLAEIGKMDIPMLKYLIITHWHWDHIFGIREMDLVTIAHENTQEKLKEMKELSWDDASLERYAKEGIFSDFTIECIKKEILHREDFNIGDLDITFNDSIEIDLGGITCIVKSIGGDHTNDSSVVYVPEEKVLFLGDCIYGTRYNGVYGYTKEKVLPMIEKIEELEANYYIISHEELYDKKEMDEFWNQLRSAESVVEKNISVEEATKRFSDKFDRLPSEDEVFYINCFADVNKAMRT
ncbi:MBL fold metallo-hydrolase [Wukongibacter sp. M2B1]|uniref:MBL fold metallo-hydrolase n=1 Tax=Wukongibacter sp. M2B1 TaxID=3088895 RepID=UPI003D7ACF3D